MYQANVYKIMIGSPSDIKEEITIAREVLNNWNNLNSEKNRMVLLPIHWSISSYPVMGKHPQKLLNEQLVEKSDLMICIFGTRLGSPTDTEISGTVEEIKEHRKAGKDVMVFFKNSVDDISSVDLQQLQKIKDFKESIKNDVLWQEFSDVKDFEKKLSDALQLFINSNWLKDSIDNEKEHSEEILFSDSEKQILLSWINSRNTNCFQVRTKDGSIYFVGDNEYQVKDGRELAEFEDFLNRLQEAGFIEIDKYNRQGDPVYKPKKAAYDYVDSITEKKD